MTPTVTATAGPSRIAELDETEVLVIGGGIAGCAIAYGLANSGRKVVMIERDLSEPDRIVGELLQPGGVAALEALGMADTLEGLDATPVEGYCVISGDREVEIPYPKIGEEVEAMLDLGEKEGHAHGHSDGVACRAEKTNGTANGHVNGTANGYANGYANGHANGYANGHANGSANGTANGHAVNGHANGNGAANGAANGKSTPYWPIPSSSGKKEGRSFHHGRFIQSLRAKVCSSSAQVVEATVRDLIYCPHSRQVIGVKCTSKGSDEEVKLYAPLTIIADGCFSKFRSAPGAVLPTPKLRSYFVGLVLKDTQLPIQNHGTVCLTPSGPVLLYQIGYKARETRMLVDVKPRDGKLPSVADGSLKQHILDDFVPHLPPSLQDGVRKALDTDRLRSMPNSFLPPSMQGLSSGMSGAIMLGDAWNMRHPLTGGGMTVAFNDAVLLTQILRPSEALPAGRAGLERWDIISPRLQDWFWTRKDLAGTVNVLSIALYDLFGGADGDLEVLREGCFRYFELGGECVAGPVGLLSGLRPEPFTLFWHFFKVAFYSIAILFKYGYPGQNRRPSPLEWPALVAYSFKVFWTACVVFLPVMASELKSNTHRRPKLPPPQ